MGRFFRKLLRRSAIHQSMEVEEGALYPALWRLELDGAISSQSGFSGNNRKAKVYQLTRRAATAVVAKVLAE